MKLGILLCVAGWQLMMAHIVDAKQGLRSKTASAPLMVCHLTMQSFTTMDRGTPSKTIFSNECSPVNNGAISDFSYPIDLPKEFVENNKDVLLSGKLFANIPGGTVVNGNIVYSFNVPITLADSPESFEARHRKLSDSNGTKSILVLRISANDATNQFNATELYNFVFGKRKPNKTPSLASQFSRMSFGKLNFVPAQNDGVLEVPVDVNANGNTKENIEDAAISYVTSKFGVDTMTQLADHVIFCIPPGTGDWSGNSPVSSWRMVLNNEWCGYLSGLMHEMGHNLGLLHSDLTDAPNTDFTSYMSLGFHQPYYPMKSFNGANHAQLGWFNDRTYKMDLSFGGFMVRMATFVDYGKITKVRPVIVQVGNGLFLQYNRAKDFNIQTQQNANQVTIVQQQSDGTTLLVGAVDEWNNKQVTIPNFEGSGRNLVIYACASQAGNTDKPDGMDVSITYDQERCISILERLPDPSKPPTRAPVKPQRPRPTKVPTSSPTTPKPTRATRRNRTSPPASL